MKTNENEIQERVEKGLYIDNDLDAIAYEKVFQLIPSEPEFYLSPQFADRVLTKIELADKKSAAREMYWLYFGIGILFVGALVGSIMIGFKPSFGAFKFLASYPGLFFFGVAFILLIQWVDKKLVRTTTF